MNSLSTFVVLPLCARTASTGGQLLVKIQSQRPSFPVCRPMDHRLVLWSYVKNVAVILDTVMVTNRYVLYKVDFSR